MSARMLHLRSCERREVVLPAKCRSRTGFVNHVIITNLSAQGCRIESHSLTLGADDLVTLRPEGLEGLIGVIRWRRNHHAGVQFINPLYEPVVDHLVQRHARFGAASSAVFASPLRRAA